MSRVYRYHTDRKTLFITLLYFIALSIGGLFIYRLYEGGYFWAWYISLGVAILTLLMLSIPRKIVADEQCVTIRCILELVEIPSNEIVSVKAVTRSEKRWIVPIFGSLGIFGYFGIYLDLATFERVKVYATEWKNLVEIVDIYDDRYYVSCRESRELIQQIEGYIAKHHTKPTEEEGLTDR